MRRDDLLRELRAYGIKNSVPNISDVNAQFLKDLIILKNAKTALEIGTANGFSTIHLGIQLEKNLGKITSIDFSPKSHKEAIQNIKQAQLEKTVKLVFGNALDIIPQLDEIYDFVFIDGMMRRSVDFLGLIWNKVEIGGVIIIDDVIKFKDKMVGLDNFLLTHNIAYNILPLDFDDGIMMIIKQDINIPYTQLSH